MFILDVLPFFAGITALFMGLVVISTGGRREKYPFGIFAISMGAWAVLITAYFLVTDENIALFIAQSYYVAAALLIYGFLLFCLYFTSALQPRALAVMSGVLGIVAAAICVMVFVPGFFITISGSDAAARDVTLMPIAYGIYSLYFIVFLALALGSLFRSLAVTKRSNGTRRAQIALIARVTSFAIPFGAVFNLILPFLGNYSLIMIGPLFVLPIVAVIFYGMKKHNLFDVRAAAVRSLAYILSLVTLSAIYYFVAYLVSTTLFKGQMSSTVSISPVNIIIALLLAFIFQPIKAFFDKTTNDIFYRSTYRSEDFFASLSTLLTSTIDLRGLLERASNQLAETFKAEQAFFFLYYTNSAEHHMSAGTHGHVRMSLYDARALDAYVKTVPESKILLTEFLPEELEARRILVSHKIAVVMPLRNAEELAGYVLLGDRMSGNYTQRDLNVLTAISNELVIAIQNALSLHEVRELNATLQQRIDVATKELRSSNAQLKHLDETKDEFISMASHQLRTPLTSIKGYISMVIEGDAGKISQQQHNLLREAFNSSERMVRLINDFLNVSRLQTGKFVIEKAPVDIKSVVQQEITSLQVMAASHGIKLRLNVTKAELPLVADEGKLRQVIMNFVDNAIYYSRKDSTIVINLERVRDDMALTVVDTGIGVPVEEQAKLFTKFFRAHNARKARPDGTGVGLYLARRVVSGHGGTIIFSSVEGKGSTFGFRLPLSKQLASLEKAAGALTDPIAK